MGLERINHIVKKIPWKRVGELLLLFAGVYVIETGLFHLVYGKQEKNQLAKEYRNATLVKEEQSKEELESRTNNLQDATNQVKQERERAIETSTENWGLGFSQEGKAPTAPMSKEELKEYSAYYLGDCNEEQKVLYLTFDAGYENGYTEAILDALKKHNAPATFFVVGNYIETSPELVKRMVAEGHTVGNHTYTHPDMSKIQSMESFEAEIGKLENLYKETTGEELVKFYRPPQGKFNVENLRMAKELGYKTFFWSLAYVDWYVDKQPTHEQAFKKLLTRIHPGSIVLLHSTSKTNAEILDELLTKWEEMGYQFKALQDIDANQ